MEPTITIASSVDVITMTGTTLDGFIYDNDSLDAWFRLPEVVAKLNKRPNAHGVYTPDQLFTTEARVPMSGKFYGVSAYDAAVARNRLSAMFADGRAVSVTVTDDLGPTTRIGFMVACEPEWMPDGIFDWTAEFAFPDPRRYGELISPSTGLATASSGLVWPLFSTAGGTWDWGTVGTPGTVTVTNAGNTTSYPVFLVGAGGTLPDGFIITEVETGRTLIYSASTGGGVVRLDSRTQRATLDGNDVTDGLTRREWPAVPANSSRTYHFATLGGTTGAPTMQAIAANAYL